MCKIPQGVTVCWQPRRNSSREEAWISVWVCLREVEVKLRLVDMVDVTAECEAHFTKPSQGLVKEISEAFEFFDLNGDGKLSVKELGTVVRSLGEAVTEEELQKLIKRVDSDGDGQLDLCEFIDLNTQAIISTCSSLDSDSSGNCRDAESDHALVAAFNKFDADKDGFISPEELHKTLAAFGDEKYSLEECRSMIKSVDENGDQVMSLLEFQTLMNENCDELLTITGSESAVEDA